MLRLLQALLLEHARTKQGCRMPRRLVTTCEGGLVVGRKMCTHKCVSVASYVVDERFEVATSIQSLEFRTEHTLDGGKHEEINNAITLHPMRTLHQR